MDPYATLNVPRDASREQVRAAFTRIARSTHPDKVGRENNTEEVGEAYRQVDMAWKVLGDDQMRDAYDEFGEDGVQALSKLRTEKLGDAVRKIRKRDLKKQVDDLRASEEATEQSDMTLVRCQMNYQDLMDLAVKGRTQFGRPIFANLFLSHSLVVQPYEDSQDRIVFHGEAGSARVRKDTVNPSEYHYSPTLGIASVAYHTSRSGNDFSFGLTGSALKDVLPEFEATVKRAFTQKFTCQTTFKADPNEASFLVAGSQAVSQGLAFTGNLFMKGGKGLLTFGVTKVVPKESGARTINSQISFPSVAPDILWSLGLTEAITNRNFFGAKCSFSFSRGPGLELESSKHITTRRNVVSAKVSWTMARGVTFRLKYANGTSRWELPILISRTFTWRAAFGSVAVPWGVQLLVQKALKPWRRSVRQKRREEIRKAALISRKRAKNQMALMRLSAETNRHEQQKADGLVILLAKYGRNLDEDYSWFDEELRPNIDVTIQLNFFVSKTDPPMLDLSQGPKSRLLGFYDPSLCSVPRNRIWSADEDEEDEGEDEQDPTRKNKLFVRYLYRGFSYEKVFEDEDSVHLPHPDAVRVE